MTTFFTSKTLAVAISEMGIPTPIQLMVLATTVILAKRLLSS